MNATRWRGFTLIEVLVAVFIFALLMLAGYGSINALLRTRDGLADQNGRLRDLQFAVGLLERDLRSALARPEPGGISRLGIRQMGSAHKPCPASMRRCSWALTLRCSWPYLLATRPPDGRKPGARPGCGAVDIVRPPASECDTSRFLTSRFTTACRHPALRRASSPMRSSTSPTR